MYTVSTVVWFVYRGVGGEIEKHWYGYKCKRKSLSVLLYADDAVLWR